MTMHWTGDPPAPAPQPPAEQTTGLASGPPAADPAAAPGADIREPRGARPARFLRSLAGVDEDLLRRVPAERARYTSLGGVVLGTAALAGFSLWNALTAVFGGAHVALLFPVLAWSLFVLNLDRWLVSSSLGSQWRRRASVLLPRLAVAAFFGIVVAEPLVLQIFHTAVEQHIKDARDAEVATLREKMLRCNPVTGGSATGPVAPAECEGQLISFAAAPTGAAAELAALRRDADVLARSITADTKELARLNDVARRECAGVAGSDTSGIPGVGDRCRRLRSDADGFAATHPIIADQQRLDGLRTRIARLEGQVRVGVDGVVRARDEEIDRRVEELRSHQGPIGMLERFQALHDLTASKPFLRIATWMIRCFFILLDCLPVLVKFFSGSTAYDKLVDDELATALRRNSWVTRAVEARIEADLEIQRHQVDVSKEMQFNRIDLDRRRHAAKVQMELSEAVDEMATGLRHRAVPPHPRRVERTVSAPNGTTKERVPDGSRGNGGFRGSDMDAGG